MTVLVTGGSGCGKSTWAERLIDGLGAGKRYYIATMRVYDEESVLRVARHRAQRAGKGYETLECPRDLQSVSVAPGAIVLLEDLPNLLANEMFEGGEAEAILPAVRALAANCAHLVVVTNDLFSDGIRYGESTAAYLRALAALNRAVAAEADCVRELVYSLPLALKGELPCVM